MLLLKGQSGDDFYIKNFVINHKIIIKIIIIIEKRKDEIERT